MERRELNALMIKCTNYRGKSAYIVHVTLYNCGLGIIISNVVHLFPIKGARSHLESSHRKARGFWCARVPAWEAERTNTADIVKKKGNHLSLSHTHTLSDNLTWTLHVLSIIPLHIISHTEPRVQLFCVRAFIFSPSPPHHLILTPEASWWMMVWGGEEGGGRQLQ